MNNTFAPLRLKAQRFNSKHRLKDEYFLLDAFNENNVIRKKLNGNENLFRNLIPVAFLLPSATRFELSSSFVSPIKFLPEYYDLFASETIRTNVAKGRKSWSRSRLRKSGRLDRKYGFEIRARNCSNRETDR